MTRLILPFLLIAIVVTPLTGCSGLLWLNPAFINQATGEVFPLVPGERSGFILVRAKNKTIVPLLFVITAERREPNEDDPDVDEVVAETFLLFTGSGARANDLGILIDCAGVFRIGLGEDLERPSVVPGIFVNPQAVGQPGTGVPGNVNPLNSDAPFFNFECGDTIVFEAVEASGVAGGVVVGAFVLDADTQPTVPIGLDTFANARTLIEEQQLEEQ